MGDFSADTLRDSIQSGWALTGALSKTASSTMKNPVKFFAHEQVKQIETRKAVEVRKVTPLSRDVIHSKFTEVSDTFEIRCRYTVEDVKNTKWDVAEQRVEDMCDEVVRIVKTVYNPNTKTGVFYRATFDWRNEDMIDKLNQVLIRTLALTLTRIKSEATTVYKGYGGVLAFDTSASTGTSKPTSDYTYTEAYNVQWIGGFRQIAELVDENSDGEHVPVLFTGSWTGRFNCEVYVKKADIGSGTHQIPTLGNPDTYGEVNDVVFLWSVTNTESTPSTLEHSIKLRIISTEPVYESGDLGKIRLVAQIVKPPVLTVT